MTVANKNSESKYTTKGRTKMAFNWRFRNNLYNPPSKANYGVTKAKGSVAKEQEKVLVVEMSDTVVNPWT
jgi:hypothetical protein